METLFWSWKEFGIIVSPDRSDHDPTFFLSRQIADPILVVGNAFDRLWWYFLFVSGHLKDRHCSSPEIHIQENWIDECHEAAFDNIKRHNESWQRLTDVLGKYFGVSEGPLAPYLQQFGSEELEEIEDDEARFCEFKASSEDRLSLASQWVYLHLVERLGVVDFSKFYWKLTDEKIDYSAGPINTPADVVPLGTHISKPPCVRAAGEGSWLDVIQSCEGHPV